MVALTKFALGFALAVSTSCCLFSFPPALLTNENVVSGGAPGGKNKCRNGFLLPNVNIKECLLGTFCLLETRDLDLCLGPC